MTAAGQVKTIEMPCAMSHWPTPVERPNSMRSRKPQTVGGRTMGIVKTESSRPLMRLEVPMVFHAANRPSAKEISRARPLVLMDTQNGR